MYRMKLTIYIYIWDFFIVIVVDYKMQRGEMLILHYKIMYIMLYNFGEWKSFLEK